MICVRTSSGCAHIVPQFGLVDIVEQTAAALSRLGIFVTVETIEEVKTLLHPNAALERSLGMQGPALRQRREERPEAQG